MIVHRTHENNKSSVFERVPPDVRHALDVAIIERIPPTFRSVWMQFELAQFGVSFTAFYRYARRLRDRANLAEAATLVGEDDADLAAALHKLVARRLLELLLHTGGAACTREIAALTSAHRQVARAAFDDRRLAEATRLAWARIENQRNHLRLKTRLVQSTKSLPASANDQGPTQNAPPLQLARPEEAELLACQSTVPHETDAGPTGSEKVSGRNDLSD